MFRNRSINENRISSFIISSVAEQQIYFSETEGLITKPNIDLCALRQALLRELIVFLQFAILTKIEFTR